MKPAFVLSRRSLVASTIAASTSLCVPVRSQAISTFRARCGTDTAPNQSSTRFLTEMFQAIERETNGAVKVEVFPASALGGSVALVDQLRVGALELVMVSSSFVASVEQTADIQAVGFAFRNPAAGYRAYDGALGQLIARRMLAKGIYRFDKIWASGFAQVLCNSHPIRTAADFSGLKLQAGGSRIISNFLATLGAIPIATNPSERYAALQTHLADGTLITLNNAEGLHLYEVQKYLSVLNCFWSTYFLMANVDVWNRLPPDVKAVLIRYADRYALMQRKDSDTADEALVTKLGQEGCIVNRADPEAFRPRLGPHYAFCRDLVGAEAWALLEQSVGKLT
jgi:TRAP-type transport system periplasmic protein